MRLIPTTLILIASIFLANRAIAQSSDWSLRALNRIANPPLGLPPVPEPQGNRATTEKITLGRKLFFDQRLSGSGAMSCATCHVPEQGFSDNQRARSVGAGGRLLKRNAPTLFNVAYQRTLFHDGREISLETQVFGPFLATTEMANPSAGWLLQTIGGLEDYWGLFEQAFGQPVNAKNLGEALASYQRTVLLANSPFDKWQYGNQKDALGASAIRGLRLFKGKAGCARCHLIKNNNALFTDHKFHNTGTGTDTGSQKPVERGPAGKENQKDLGRMKVTGNPADLYCFKTPTLRNIALTAPYMHDGSMRTLADVVAFYNKGPSRSLRPLHLSKAEQAALVAFLKSLTGDNVDELVSKAQTLEQPAFK